MLERDDTSENTRTKSSGKKRKSSVGGRERKERRMDGDCKEKVVSSKDEMETMKGKVYCCHVKIGGSRFEDMLIRHP